MYKGASVSLPEGKDPSDPDVDRDSDVIAHRIAAVTNFVTRSALHIYSESRRLASGGPGDGGDEDGGSTEGGSDEGDEGPTGQGGSGTAGDGPIIGNPGSSPPASGPIQGTPGQHGGPPGVGPIAGLPPGSAPPGGPPGVAPPIGTPPGQQPPPPERPYIDDPFERDNFRNDNNRRKNKNNNNKDKNNKNKNKNAKNKNPKNKKQDTPLSPPGGVEAKLAEASQIPEFPILPMPQVPPMAIFNPYQEINDNLSALLGRLLLSMQQSANELANALDSDSYIAGFFNIARQSNETRTAIVASAQTFSAALGFGARFGPRQPLNTFANGTGAPPFLPENQALVNASDLARQPASQFQPRTQRAVTRPKVRRGVSRPKAKTH